MSDEKPETPDEDKPTEFPTKPEGAAAAARDQAAEYDSPFAPITLRFDDGTTMEIPPHPNLRLLDDDCLAAYDALVFESQSYDRAPDIHVPPQKIYDQHTKKLVTTLPATTQRGQLLMPFQKGGELVTPPWEIKVVIAALGQEVYDELRTRTIDGKRAGALNVQRAWTESQGRVKEREAEDPKSDGSTVDLAPVSEGDSAGSAPVPQRPEDS